MLISEIQCEESTGDMAAKIMEKLTDLIADMEKNMPLGNVSKEAAEEIRQVLGTVPSSISSEQRLQLWRLSFQIWNACVEHTNGLESGKSPSIIDALLRHVSADMLLAAGENPNVKGSLMKMAAFFARTGTAWHDLKDYATAETCFSKAMELCSHMREDFGQVEGSSCNSRAEKKEFDRLSFEIFTDRAKNAWQVSQRALATSLLDRASSILANLPEKSTDLAELYLHIGRTLLSKTEEKNTTSESLIYLEKAYELCTTTFSGRHLSGEALSQASSLKNRVLRYLAGAHVQNEDWQAAMKCTAALKASSDHACIPYLELKALAGLGRLGDAAREMEVLVSHKGCSIELGAAGLDALLSSEGVNSVVPLVKKSFFDLHARFPADSKLVVLALEKLLRGTAGVSNTSQTAIGMALEVVNTQSISRLIAGSPKQLGNNEDRKCVFALLWNSATGKFHVKDWNTSQALFEASMLYIPEGDTMMRAKILRLICLCYLGDGKHEQAKWFVDEAEKLDSSIASTFLKFKIALQSDSLEEASAQVKKMSTCRDFEPDFLTLASHEAVASNQAPVAVAALCSLLALDCTDQASKVKEAIIIRNIITLLSEKMGKGAEDILPYYQQAKERLDASTVAAFCGDGSPGEQEGLWFAASALDHGLQLGKDGKWQLSSEFLVVAAAFYNALPGSPENLQSERLALILASSVLLESGEVDSKTLELANKSLERCKSIYEQLPVSAGMNAVEDTTEMHFHMLLFNAKRRLGDSEAQVDVLNRCSSLPACTYAHFLVMAQQASDGKSSNLAVARAAYVVCLARILESPSPDYKALAQIVRKLIRLVDSFDKSGNEVLGLYVRAEEIVRGLRAGVYLKEEAQWLVSTAWNRGVMHSNFDEYDQAERWMEIAIKLRKYAPGMESSEALMTKVLKQVRLDKQREGSCVE